MNNEINRILYPRLIRRVQALVIDSVIFLFLIVTLFLLMTTFENSPQWLRVMFVLLPIFILEPGLVSLTGGTIGHHLIKLRVQNADNGRNINIVLATFRFIVKTAFGYLSLISVLTTRKHQAIHDFLVNSVVVFRDVKQIPSHDALPERIFEEAGYIYPSKIRRVFIILFYNIMLFIVISLIGALLVSDACIENDHCTSTEEVISYIIGFLWFISSMTLLVAGWKARLLGCRRKRIESSDIACP